MRIMAMIIAAILFAALAPAVQAAGNETIWEFDNFQNKYKLWKTDKCDIYGKNSCPSEFGWQGKKVTIEFRKDDERLSDELVFSFYVGYSHFGTDKDALVNITAKGKGKTAKIATKEAITGRGTYSFTIPAGTFSANVKNTITIDAKNISPGYGRNPA